MFFSLPKARLITLFWTRLRTVDLNWQLMTDPLYLRGFISNVSISCLFLYVLHAKHKSTLIILFNLSRWTSFLLNVCQYEHQLRYLSSMVLNTNDVTCIIVKRLVCHTFHNWYRQMYANFPLFHQLTAPRVADIWLTVKQYYVMRQHRIENRL